MQKTIWKPGTVKDYEVQHLETKETSFTLYIDTNSEMKPFKKTMSDVKFSYFVETLLTKLNSLNFPSLINKKLEYAEDASGEIAEIRPTAETFEDSKYVFFWQHKKREQKEETPIL